MFQAFPKIPRLFREFVMTEKLDGTNAQVLITPLAAVALEERDKAVDVVDGLAVFAGSRARFVTPADDNFGFAEWV